MDCLISLAIVVGSLLGIIFLSLSINLFLEYHKVSNIVTSLKTPPSSPKVSDNTTYKDNVVSIDKWRKS